jgi:hypothetical protein
MMEFIVGTVLAGIPVVLEAYDRYWRLAAGFSTFRHSSTEFTKLETVLKTQKTLFRSDALQLLSSVTNDPEFAKELLSDSNSPNWAQLRLDDAYNNRVDGLRDTFSSWMATAMQIKLALGTLSRDFTNLRTTSREFQEVNPSFNPPGCRHTC